MDQGLTVDKANKWDVLADTWQDTGPPASPSNQDIQIYNRFLKRAVKTVDNRSILLLGCTPHIRILLNELEFTVVCVDISEKMLAKTTSIMGRANSRETLVCQDWVQMDLRESKFSAIVGDKILDNIPYTQWESFKQRILIHLAPGGYFVTRVAPQDVSLLGVSFTELLKKWAHLYESRSLSIRDAISGLWEQALGASGQSLPGRQSISAFTQEIKALDIATRKLRNSEAKILREFQEMFEKSFHYEWTAYTLGNVIDAFAEELFLLELARAKDYPTAKRQPILMFRAN